VRAGSGNRPTRIISTCPSGRRQLEELKANDSDWFDVDMKYGTIGAVARDVHGHVAAATSTGGITGKRWGRIGDSR
jgi:beta-aspartyl-peptidase (threonine type)